MESFQYTGIWWLPNKPDDQISGILRFDLFKGSTLELTGDFATQLEHQEKYYSIIYGVIENAKPVTLRDCYTIERGHALRSIYEFDRHNLTIDVVFVGYHFLSDKDIVFEGLNVGYSYLSQWIGSNAFIVNQTSNLSNYTVQYNKPKPIVAKIDQISVSLRQFSHRRVDLEEVVLKQQTLAGFFPSDPQHFDFFLDIAFFHFRNFLSLAISKPVYIERIVGNIPGKHSEVEIYLPFARPVQIPKFGHPRYTLFLFDDIKESFEAYLNHWFSKAKILDPIYELYFGVIYDFAHNLNLQFLRLAQALEAYHRLMHDGVYLSRTEFRRVQDALFQAIPDELAPEFKETLKSRIGFANEYSLQTRLSLILDDVLKPYRKQVDSLIEDKIIFVKTIKDTRNHLTHHSHKGKHTISDMGEMDIHIEKMKLILQMCFLVELEFSPEQASRLINQNMRYINLIRNNI